MCVRVYDFYYLSLHVTQTPSSPSAGFFFLPYDVSQIGRQPFVSFVRVPIIPHTGNGNQCEASGWCDAQENRFLVPEKICFLLMNYTALTVVWRLVTKSTDLKKKGTLSAVSLTCTDRGVISSARAVLTTLADSSANYAVWGQNSKSLRISSHYCSPWLGSETGTFTL